MEYVFACVAFLLINIFYEGLVSFIGFLLFNCLTLGLVRVDPINEKNVFFPWHGFARDSNGQLLIKASTSELYSILLLVLGTALVIAYYKYGF